MTKIWGIILTIIGSIVAILGLIIKINGQISASIIGEADSATSTFIASKIGGTSAVIGIFLGIVLVVVGIAIIARENDL